jgi:NTP pyrophosphatase (non-canonical NTP hydrolase)
MTTFDEYQGKANATAIYPGQGSDSGLLYVTLGLAGEAGEVANKVKKLLTEGTSENAVKAILDELGDVLWHAAQLATEFGESLNIVADNNSAKLLDRMERGTLRGDGDAR